MKIVFTFLLVFLFVGCGVEEPKPKVYPQWYKNRQLQSAIKYEIIGYGNGKTIKEAEATAKEDIAQTLISKVDSSFTMSQTETTNSFNQNSNSKLIVTSKINLQNVMTIKQEQIDGLFNVALKYENLDLAYRIKTTADSFECTQQKINSYLAQTPLIIKLTASLGCELDFKIDRRNKAWYLKYKEHLFLLSDDEFEELFVTTKNNDFDFKSNKTVLLNGDSFYFTFNSKEDGYITLLNVYENGIVTLLQPSVPIKNTLQIPLKDSENYFEAGVIKEGVDTYDLYVAVYTKEPLDMSRFEYANEDLAESELAYKFDELIRVINGYKYSSLMLRTRVK